MSETAICSIALPAVAEGGVPEWVHILPAGEFSGVDGRGPWRLGDAAAVAAATAVPIAVDINHSTVLAGAKGGDAEAVGWVEHIEARPDGLWARVAWNKRGRELVGDRRYRFLSPEFHHAADGAVLAIRRIALTNNPNLSLTALNQQQEEGGVSKPDTTPAGDAAGRIIGELKTTLAVANDGDLVETVRALKAHADDKVALAHRVERLQGQLAAVLAERVADQVDARIAAGDIVPADRDLYVAMATAMPDQFARQMKAVAGRGTALTKTSVAAGAPPAAGGGKADAQVVAMCTALGISVESYEKTAAAGAEGGAA